MKIDPSETINNILKDMPASFEETEPVTPEPEVEPQPEPEAEVPAAPVEETEDDITFQSPPGGPIWSEAEEETATEPELPTITLNDGSTLTAVQVEALLVGTRTPPPAPVNVPTPVPSSEAIGPSLPAFTDEDLENPAIRAVVMIAAKQQEELATLRQQQQQVAEAVAVRQHHENAEAVNSATAFFKAEYNLPDDLMEKVSNHAAIYLKPEYERLMEAGTPNSYQAVINSLQAAYWNVPEARRFEFDRQSDNRQKAVARKQKLNGVGGTQGVAPAVEPQSMYDAMVAEVAESMGVQQ